MHQPARRRVTQGVLAGGLGYLTLGSGAPLVVAPGLAPDHRPPLGVGRRVHLLQLRPLARARTVWWVNRRQGLRPGTSMTDLAADYADALRATFDAPVDVLGISTGGSVALQLALDSPELVRRVVVVASGCRLGFTGKREQRALAAEIRAGRSRAAAARVWGMGGSARASRTVLGAAGWLLGGAYFAVDQPGDVLGTLEAEDRFDVTARLGEIGLPVLVIGGDRDRIYDGGRVFVDTAEGIPGARLVVYPGKGHLGVLRSRRTVRDALAFLSA